MIIKSPLRRKEFVEKNNSPSRVTIPTNSSFRDMALRSRTQSSSYFGRRALKVKFEKLKKLAACKSTDEARKVLLKKLEQCHILFDFANPVCNIEGKRVKHAILMEIELYLQAHMEVINREVCEAVVRMAGINLLRVLPPCSSLVADFDEECPVREAAWPHLQLVYSLFIMVVECATFDGNWVVPVIDTRYVTKLMELFDSEDRRERSLLKTVVHRIYSKCIPLRSIFRQTMNNILIRFTHETNRFSGVSELLEVYISIVNGFVLPLKEDHKQLFTRVLLPLHKSSCVSHFHTQLSHCMVHFIDKDPGLTRALIKTLLRYWPKVSSQNELLFLAELESVLEQCDSVTFEAVMRPVFKTISIASASQHFLVSERALAFWQNDYVMQLFIEHASVLIPIVFDRLYTTAITHWNMTISNGATMVISSLLDINPEVCSHCADVYQDKMQNNEARWSQQLEEFADRLTNL